MHACVHACFPSLSFLPSFHSKLSSCLPKFHPILSLLHSSSLMRGTSSPYLPPDGRLPHRDGPVCSGICATNTPVGFCRDHTIIILLGTLFGTCWLVNLLVWDNLPRPPTFTGTYPPTHCFLCGETLDRQVLQLTWTFYPPNTSSVYYALVVFSCMDVCVLLCYLPHLPPFGTTTYITLPHTMPSGLLTTDYDSIAIPILLCMCGAYYYAIGPFLCVLFLLLSTFFFCGYSLTIYPSFPFCGFCKPHVA